MKKLILSVLVAGLIPLSVQADLEFTPFPFLTPDWSSGLIVSSTWADYQTLVGITQKQPGQRLPFKSTQASDDWFKLLKVNSENEVIFKTTNWADLFTYNVGTKGKCPGPYITWLNGKLKVVNPCSNESE